MAIIDDVLQFVFVGSLLFIFRLRATKCVGSAAVAAAAASHASVAHLLRCARGVVLYRFLSLAACRGGTTVELSNPRIAYRGCILEYPPFINNVPSSVDDAAHTCCCPTTTSPDSTRGRASCASSRCK
jgi:hypothetical protein